MPIFRRKAKKAEEPQEPLQCPESGQTCDYRSFCLGKQALDAVGRKLLPPDFADNFPAEAIALGEVTAAVDDNFCSRRIIGALWEIANRPDEHPDVVEQARNLGMIFLDQRSNFAHWEQPPH